MREASFIERNKEKWILIENNLRNKINVDPDVLASDYIELTNDLAYAQTFYPRSKTKDYLNELAILAHQQLYRDQKSSENQFKRFVQQEIPEAIWQLRRPLLYSLLIFCLAIAIGFISAQYDLDFVRLILGDYYVDMSIANIESGNPAGVYQGGSEVGSALAITINNVRVAFLAFVLGVFYSIGTGYILFSNGIMVGAFHHLFFRYGVMQEAMSAIWIHGAIELSVIVIAGGCGLAIGNSILFPKSYTRLESFKRAMKTASKVLVSTIPFFIVAGFLEGFVTRHYQVSIWLCISIIIASFTAIIYFYIIRPYQLARINGWK
ncbi:stage II sporulation protein M [Sphingobacterium phlebotomi]|uniref:Stage II sporulation protein M n=1 Tax=Sphingobacterium phlebotomi TaxID=2605433 RepID=A0A5D4H9R8_9SPHI|nr:stage II sporulation protein M [Sphingobacterium phlebotomi]TYR37042.1 stage II sporulation protein M [Sphingobacterium phlebotomi]